MFMRTKVLKQTSVLIFTLFLLCVSAFASTEAVVSVEMEEEHYSELDTYPTFDIQSEIYKIDASAEESFHVKISVVPPKRKLLDRYPLAVAFVLDKSGSMQSEGKFDRASSACVFGTGKLAVEDVASLVVYDDQASVLVDSVFVGEENVVEKFESALSDVFPGGATALYDGLILGMESISGLDSDGYAQRIILLSDGIANRGLSSISELRRAARKASANNFTITTIGLGLDYNEDVMTSIAYESGGNAYFVKRASDLENIFNKEITNAGTLTAAELTIKFAVPDNFIIKKIYGHKNEIKDEKTAVITVGNLYDYEKYAIVEVVKKPGESNLKMELSASFTDPATSDPIDSKQGLELEYSETTEKNSSISSFVEKMKNAEIKEQVMILTDQGKKDEAVVLLKTRMEELKVLPNGEDFLKDVQNFKSIVEELSASPNSSLKNETRKSLSTMVYSEQTQNQKE